VTNGAAQERACPNHSQNCWLWRGSGRRLQPKSGVFLGPSGAHFEGLNRGSGVTLEKNDGLGVSLML
jgi:hypothetical protein